MPIFEGTSLGRVQPIFRGTYSAIIEYNKLDNVYYNGSTWVCKINRTIGITPSENSGNWQLVANGSSSLPQGGTTGQILRKSALGSEWSDESVATDSQVQNAVDDYLENHSIAGTFTNTAKRALLACFQKVAWINEDGQIYYNELEEALFGLSYTITNQLTGCVNSNNSTQVREGELYSAVITANWGYVLNEVTITMGGTDVTRSYYSEGQINIPNVTGDIVITAVAISRVSSISAVYTPGTDVPIEISQNQIVSGYINTDYAWMAANDSFSVCIPVTVDKTYALEFTTTDSSVVSTIFRYGFSDSQTPSAQILSGVVRATPQDRPYALIKPDKPYLVIQLGLSKGESVVSNNYLTLTEINSTVYTWSSLDSLKQNLVVTANYVTGDSEVLDNNDYTLIGNIAEGTQTITVSAASKTTTFNVTCVVNGWLYHFENNLLSAGNKDFEFMWSGESENYSTGKDNTGYSYWHKVATEGTSSTEQGSIYAVGYTPPDLSGDFTISFWYKGVTDYRGQLLSPFTVGTTSGNATQLSNANNIASGWSVVKDSVGKTVEGIRIWYTGNKLQIRLISSDLSTGSSYNIILPTNTVSTVWHHYALTRKAGVIRFFFDGNVVFTINSTNKLLFATQLAIGSYFENTVGFPEKYFSNGYFDDYFISEYCKWDSAFNVNNINY